MVGVVFWWAASSGAAQFPERRDAVSSITGQFIVSRPERLMAFQKKPVDEDDERVELTPDLVAVSCERIKGEFLRSLGLRDEAGGPVYISINSNKPEDEIILVVARIYQNRWVYEVELPARLEARQLIRVVVQALLKDQANRPPGSGDAAVPLWLTEGLTHLLADRATAPLILRAQSTVNRMSRREDPMHKVRLVLQESSALTFAELQTPPEQFEENSIGPEQFQRSAQLFVYELLRLPNGPSLMVRWIRHLGVHLNWQTTFLEVYRDHFDSLLAVEKWWSLSTLEFTILESRFHLRPEVGLARLGEILELRTSLRSDDEAVPEVTRLSLQQFLQTADYEHQREGIEETLQQLNLLARRADPKLYALVQRYYTTLREYLHDRALAGYASYQKHRHHRSPQVLVDTAVDRLNRIDRDRADYRSRLEQQTENSRDDQSASVQIP